jgi:tRNA-Thr(GGU) m(6)t(6)A37 methyltransferase TsaA
LNPVDDPLSIAMTPLAFVRSPRRDVRDDDWGQVVARIELTDALPDEALHGLEAFSHVEVVYHFHRVPAQAVVTGARHPRGELRWPRVGILAQRAKARPNRIGVGVCELMGVDARTLHVRGLDAVDGTPVLDVKPVMAEFLPRSPVRQPAWSTELMATYWAASQPAPTSPDDGPGTFATGDDR